jgi:uncharacterized glyoxalase superfamily protein PhnB
VSVIRIDKDRALQLLREVVAGREDYVYPGSDCRYVDGDACGCLIGHALFHAGASMDQLLALDAWADGDTSIGHVSPDWLDLTDEARSVFTVAQEVQDGSHRWGWALEQAEVAA